MNKKIIALALSTSCVAPLALADVTIYGVIGSGIESVSATGGATTSSSHIRVQDENSLIGFKGEEKLGNGLKAIWQVESSLRNMDAGGVNEANASATFATRNTFVGLSDDTMGTVQLGYFDSAYKRLTTSAIGTDLMTNTTASTNVANGVVTRGDARLKNSVNYTTATWHGLQGGISWGADETRTDSAGNPTSSQRYSLAADYLANGLAIGLGYDHQGDTSLKTLSAASGEATTVVNGVSTSYSKLAASYKFGSGTFIAAQIERASYGLLGRSAMTQNDWSLGVSQDVGAASFKLSYNKLGALNNATSGAPDQWSAKMWVLGSTYNLSKTTQLLAYYTRLSNSQYQSADFANNPVYTANDNTTSASLASGSAVSAVGFGMKVFF